MESVEAPSRVPAAEGAASRRTPELSFRVWPGPTPGSTREDEEATPGRSLQPELPCAGARPVSAPGNAGKLPRPSPRSSPPAARRSPAPYCRGVGPATPALPAFAPRTPQLRIGRSRSLRASSLPPLDWLHPGAEAPPISPGPLITRRPALPGPGSQPRAFLSGLQRREVPSTVGRRACDRASSVPPRTPGQGALWRRPPEAPLPMLTTQPSGCRCHE
ncbi:small integral membrane protein 29 isoform X1 [Mustela erminea]|uniref:small integral membrane protein 29 isoform X1 n=1 Tax=Mustela erminea TaxID=36723 RepID=UPI00138681E7|nr:small integral membrane protein 29 isoform X1 [Mustela erminea]